jgi:hypothetical protein
VFVTVSAQDVASASRGFVAGGFAIAINRPATVLARDTWYTWIYATILADEKQIAGVVDRHHLRVP